MAIIVFASHSANLLHGMRPEPLEKRTQWLSRAGSRPAWLQLCNSMKERGWVESFASRAPSCDLTVQMSSVESVIFLCDAASIPEPPALWSWIQSPSPVCVCNECAIAELHRVTVAGTTGWRPVGSGGCSMGKGDCGSRTTMRRPLGRRERLKSGCRDDQSAACRWTGLPELPAIFSSICCCFLMAGRRCEANTRSSASARGFFATWSNNWIDATCICCRC